MVMVEYHCQVLKVDVHGESIDETWEDDFEAGNRGDALKQLITRDDIVKELVEAPEEHTFEFVVTEKLQWQQQQDESIRHELRMQGFPESDGSVWSEEDQEFY